ncbi:DUF2269 domain-containing protein (plasmid) [Burkholderia sp. FERM BP-3421]|jgi:uncharacterized membrane protein|uniref:DUF2269 family protein n=1 Tax=Burkholderia sp. FERM BP-3421 TaxID=1494466 RepID=UPI002363096D|nr:DUF2269 domain-containing protein [Burkholderia sp. FERM BP-3421]WDD90527.1 DUF2269 domain-containing protein [Burkholderia sp. FERM BP-3421]
MNTYLILKCVHILSSTVLFGTGIGIAFFKWITDRSGDVRAIRIVTERTVLADWIFTTPAVILQPLTGLGLAWPAGYAIGSGWIFYAICLYLLAGCCWLPVVWLQMRMRDIARIADAECTTLPRQYWQYARAWFWLGVPAFSALVIVYWLMVFKPAL